MNDANIQDIPKSYETVLAKSLEIGFTMPSDMYIGTLLKTLLSSKPGGRFLEMGTGIGLSLVWMIEGLTGKSRLISVDNDPKLVQIARNNFGKDNRIEIVCTNGSDWIKNYNGEKFDLIFADAWPGKYSDLEETLKLINIGGFYVIDDMNEQPNWPEGHAEKANALVEYLENRDDFTITKMNWSTGVIVGVKV